MSVQQPSKRQLAERRIGEQMAKQSQQQTTVKKPVVAKGSRRWASNGPSVK